MRHTAVIATSVTCVILLIACSEREKDVRIDNVAITAVEPDEVAVFEGLRLKSGMDYETALELLMDSGAEEFECGYRYAMLSPGDGKIRKRVWYTLVNGMSIEIIGEGVEDGKLLIASLAVCDSTALFCCKGESWFGLDEIAASREKTVIIGGFEEGEGKRKFLHVGMGMEEAIGILAAAGIAKEPISDEIRGQLRNPESWHQYRLASGDLLVGFASGDAGVPNVQQMVISGIKPAFGANAAEDFWIESEVIDVHKPLKEGWHWAFSKRDAWNPSKDPDPRIRSTGQRR